MFHKFPIHPSGKWMQVLKQKEIFYKDKMMFEKQQKSEWRYLTKFAKEIIAKDYLKKLK